MLTILHCALDYAWLQTIERLVPAAVDDRAKFSVPKAIEQLEGCLTKAEIHIASPNLFRFMLDAIKPCEGGDFAIWPIHNLDIRDKHRLFIPVLSAGHIDGIEVEDQSGETFRGFGTGDIQRPPYWISFERGLHVKKKGKCTASIVVEDRKSSLHMHVPETFRHYSHYILCVAESFERFLESQPGG